MRNHRRTVAPRLAHAEDATRTHLDPGLTHLRNGIDAILMLVRGDHLIVKLGIGIEVVVVVVKPGLLELAGLPVLEHAQGNAGFQAKRLDLANHLRDNLQLFFLRAAPCRPHTETRGPFGLGLLGSGQHVRNLHQRFALGFGLIARRLRAIAAILGTAPGLDRNQSRTLHLVGIEILSMHLLCTKQQIHQRQLVERLNLGNRPFGRSC